MPPVKPTTEMYQALDARVKQIVAADYVRQNEQPIHQKLYKKAAGIIAQYGKEFQFGDQTIRRVTPWYLNPNLTAGQVRTYYALETGAVIENTFIENALALKVGATKPNPVVTGEVVVIEEVVAILTGTKFMHEGTVVDEPMTGLVFPHKPLEALDSQAAYFQRFKDTIDFIAQTAAQTPPPTT